MAAAANPINEWHQNCNPRLAGAARRQGYTNSPSQHLSVPLRQHSGGGSSGCLHNLIILHQKQDEFPADNISRFLKRLPANEPATSAASSRGQSADESQQQAALQPHSPHGEALFLCWLQCCAAARRAHSRP